jgi:hypothetical protein
MLISEGKQAGNSSDEWELQLETANRQMALMTATQRHDWKIVGPDF